MPVIAMGLASDRLGRAWTGILTASAGCSLTGSGGGSVAVPVVAVRLTSDRLGWAWTGIFAACCFLTGSCGGGSRGRSGGGTGGGCFSHGRTIAVPVVTVRFASNRLSGTRARILCCGNAARSDSGVGGGGRSLAMPKITESVPTKDEVEVGC